MHKTLTKAALAGAAALVAALATPALADTPAGLRVEGLLGWDHTSLDEGQYGYGSYGKDSLGFGAAVGYDIPIAPRVTVGMDAEIDGSSSDYHGGGTWIHTGRDLYIGGRATLGLTPTTNAYVKLGYANGRIDASTPAYYLSEDRDGIRVGVGLQHQLMRNIYGLVEYRHTSYQDNFSRDQLMTGLGVHF